LPKVAKLVTPNKDQGIVTRKLKNNFCFVLKTNALLSKYASHAIVFALSLSLSRFAKRQMKAATTVEDFLFVLNSQAF
jgi:hypothetical protein